MKCNIEKVSDKIKTIGLKNWSRFSSFPSAEKLEKGSSKGDRPSDLMQIPRVIKPALIYVGVTKVIIGYITGSIIALTVATIFLRDYQTDVIPLEGRCLVPKLV